MLDWYLLQVILVIAIACSTITVAFIQKTKKFCRNSRCITLYSFIVNMLFGYFFSMTFASIDYVKSLWVGLFSFIGADTIYRNLEGKLSSYSDLVVRKPTDNNGMATDTDNGQQDSSEESNTPSDEEIIGEIHYE
jgi:hypothetical protein